MKTQLITSTKNPILILEAFRWLGVQEVGGNNKGQVVSIFQRHLGGAHEEPWCMSFVQYCCFWVDSMDAAFRSQKAKGHKLFKSEHCLTVWNKSPRECRSEAPMPGSVVIWQYGASSAGHTGIVVDVDGDVFTTVEANTGDNSKRVVREGDGVYKKVRPLKSIGKMKIKGFLNPWPE